jgi:BON domain
MRTNHIRVSLFAGALAACLWISSGSTALAQAGDLQASVSSAIAQDAMLKNQPITAAVANGIVTLSGTVETAQQRQQAETDAANVPGVSGIQNNLTVTGSSDQGQPTPPPPADNQQAPPPPPDNEQPQSSPQNSGAMPPPPPPDQPSQQAPPPAARAPYPQGGYPQQTYPQPRPYGGYNNYPPPQPTSGPVTIPAGTLLQIRLSEPLDLGKLQDGQVFQATAASDVFEGNVLAIPRGAVLQGTVVHVKKPSGLGGSPELELQITSLNLGGNAYPLASDIWTSKGPNKAGYTAGNTVGGAALGAIIGGLIGRGPGAAVGAVAGGVGGLAVSNATNGARFYLPAEAMLNFHLTNAITVQPVSWQEAQRLANSVPQLQRRRVYYAPYPYPYPYPYAYRVYGW